MKKRENQAVDALVARRDGNEFAIRWTEDIPADEWKQVFEEFKIFPYQLPANRFLDCETIVIKGLGILLQAKAWDECIRLTEWALADPQFRNESTMTPSAHYYKALALIHQGRSEFSLEYYLAQMSAMPKGLNRRGAFVLGCILINDFMLIQGGFKEDLKEDKCEAPDNVVRFARGLVTIHYPNRKLPVLLREHQKTANVTYGKIRQALSRF